MFSKPENTISEPVGILSQREWGTFKDSLKAPIYRWFTYPAGFSYKAVAYSLKINNIQQGHTVYDPFMGSATTNVLAKKLGINSYGIEAHPFVYQIAQTKLDWSISADQVISALSKIEDDVLSKIKIRYQSNSDLLKKEFPELVLKCYSEDTLAELLLIRNSLSSQNLDTKTYNFFFVALTGLLRKISCVATGWPYIAPNKTKVTSNGKVPLNEFKKCVYEMLDDVRITISEANPNYAESQHHIFNADSRSTIGLIEDLSIDHIFTSPPYLNNFDYSDRTRLELYFFGRAKNWGDISSSVRSKLITSATTQISRVDPRYLLSSELLSASPEIYSHLIHVSEQLAQLRLQKGGKKSYDLLVTGYFNDMFLSLKDAFRVLKRGRTAVYVLGDSAPYGVHVATDELIGQIGVSIGFADYKIVPLRERGGKWPGNPQRHKVKLKESVVILNKA